MIAIVDAAAELADETGVWDAADLAVLPDPATSRRADYALAAGTGVAQSAPLAVASGSQSLNWVAVPQGVFDAADETVEWLVETVGGDRGGDGPRRHDRLAPPPTSRSASGPER